MIVYADKIFKNPLKIIKAFDSEGFKKAFCEIEQLKNKYYLVGYVRYESKDIFLGKNVVSKFPLLYFEVFDKYEKFESVDINKNIQLSIIPKFTQKEYLENILKIKSEIASGNTYEVNYTVEFDVDFFDSSPFDIFNKYLKVQKTPYNAFIENEYEQILSFSPELFFKVDNSVIYTKPMKGTISRGANNLEDIRNIEFLKHDLKNKAENVMIVDLLRNDIGKICKAGTVKVPKLFEIETHKTLHQMTSTVIGELEPYITLYDIFEGLFPCGSITGAPKVSTMRIIDELEGSSRGVYCGAIGMIYNDFCEFSVPIRILQKDKKSLNYIYRAGGAIVWDSVGEDELEEVYTKMKFLYPFCDNYNLIETIRIKNGKLIFFKEHLERLKVSAEKLGYIYNEELENIIPEKDGILRIKLSKNGNYNLEYRDYKRNLTDKVNISHAIIPSDYKMSLYKTGFRPFFVESYKKIQQGEVYDELYFNERGELLEGAISNILIQKEGNFYTPTLTSNFLNGVLRKFMVENGFCVEKVLYKEDLETADGIFCMNSVRGIKKVHL